MHHHCCRLARIEFTFLLIFTDEWPSHAVSDAIASPKTSDEEFLVGPVNRRGITQSVDKTFDDPSIVLQTDVNSLPARMSRPTDRVPSDTKSQTPTFSPSQSQGTNREENLRPSIRGPPVRPPKCQNELPTQSIELDYISGADQPRNAEKQHRNHGSHKFGEQLLRVIDGKTPKGSKYSAAEKYYICYSCGSETATVI